MAVGQQVGDDPGVIPIPKDNPGGVWGAVWLGLADMIAPARGKVKGAGAVTGLLRHIGYLPFTLADRLGLEYFDFPGSRRILDISPIRPDIVQAHNLHGGYFDLRVLPELSARAPVVLTLHDAWLLSGHCAHSFDCERWRHGCGRCPDLTIPPAIRRDATAINWRRKQRIFHKSNVYVATPSRWLLDKVKQSLVAPAIRESRVIPNGVDLSVFRPADRVAARRRLGLPEDELLLLFAANGLRNNPWKDFATLRSAIQVLGSKMFPRRARLLALGGTGPEEAIGNVVLTYVPFETSQTRVAAYYQAADLYLHAAKADTFPNAVIEALACGTPVVATSVGGIPEQVRSFAAPGHDSRYAGPEDVATGILTPPADPLALAMATSYLLEHDATRRQLAVNAVQDATHRFSIDRQADEYLAWFEEIQSHRLDLL